MWAHFIKSVSTRIDFRAPPHSVSSENISAFQIGKATCARNSWAAREMNKPLEVERIEVKRLITQKGKTELTSLLALGVWRIVLSHSDSFQVETFSSSVIIHGNSLVVLCGKSTSHELSPIVLYFLTEGKNYFYLFWQMICLISPSIYTLFAKMEKQTGSRFRNWDGEIANEVGR